jgi:hypothetical protein
MRIVREKRGNEIVKNMHNNFAKETNQRDEDAEMQKFIEEQLRLKRDAETLKNTGSSDAGSSVDTGERKYKTPEEALFDLPKYLIENKSKNKSEETLSEQMLSGIPEVDLGVEERIKNIEETERAKQRMLSRPGEQSAAASTSTAAHHKQFATVRTDQARHSHYQQNKRKATDGHQDGKRSGGGAGAGGGGEPPVEKASDDYCLDKFKKNMRQSRNSRIRIA